MQTNSTPCTACRKVAWPSRLTYSLKKRAGGLGGSSNCCHCSRPRPRKALTRRQGPSADGATSSSTRAGANMSALPSKFNAFTTRGLPRSKTSHLSRLHQHTHGEGVRTLQALRAHTPWGQFSRHHLHALSTGHEPTGVAVAVSSACWLIACEVVRCGDDRRPDGSLSITRGNQQRARRPRRESAADGNVRHEEQRKAAAPRGHQHPRWEGSAGTGSFFPRHI